jgi:hypothetical protein
MFAEYDLQVHYDTQIHLQRTQPKINRAHAAAMCLQALVRCLLLRSSAWGGVISPGQAHSEGEVDESAVLEDNLNLMYQAEELKSHAFRKSA